MMARSGRAFSPASPTVRSHLVVLTLNTLLLHFMPHGSMQRCPLIHATLIVNPTFDMHRAHSILILFFLFVPLLLLSPLTPHPLSFSSYSHSFLQDGYYSHRPKEKNRVDSNNENSVPKDFENIDNSNFGARSQPHRQSVGATSSKQQREHLQEKAHTQQQTWRDSSPSLGRSSNEVLPVGHQPLAVGNNASYAGGQGAAGGPRQHYHASQQAQQTQSQHRHQHPHRRQATTAPLEVTYDQPPKCEISGKEAISALSRAKSKECRQQIAEVYCRHKEGQLMPEKVTRYCPLEGESMIIINLIDYLILVNRKCYVCEVSAVTLYSAQTLSR